MTTSQTHSLRQIPLHLKIYKYTIHTTNPAAASADHELAAGIFSSDLLSARGTAAQAGLEPPLCCNWLAC